MEFKTYEYLAEDAKMIRQIVFMQEQGFVDEFDDTDLQATQIVLYDEGNQSQPAEFSRETKRMHLFLEDWQC